MDLNVLASADYEVYVVCLAVIVILIGLMIFIKTLKLIISAIILIVLCVGIMHFTGNNKIVDKYNLSITGSNINFTYQDVKHTIPVKNIGQVGVVSNEDTNEYVITYVNENNETVEIVLDREDKDEKTLGKMVSSLIDNVKDKNNIE